MTTPPAVFGQFGQALAFAERNRTANLREHLARRGIKPETWYALQLLATRGPGLARDELCRLLEGSRNLDAKSTQELLARLEAEGLIRGDTEVDLTVEGKAMHQSLREYIAGPTIRLLGQFDIQDIETTVRTMQAITRLAEEESSSPAT